MPKGKYIHRKTGLKVIRVGVPCQICGKVILISEAELKRRKNLSFCSKSCSGIGRKIEGKEKIQAICVVCNKPFKIQPSRLGKIVTCSRTCSIQYKSQNSSRQRKFTDTQGAVDLYEKGYTQAEVADKMGVSQKLIRIRLKEAQIKCRRAVVRDGKGGKSYIWKGDEASYQAFHMRVYSLRGTPSYCETCGLNDPSRYYAWANLTGKYNDPNDYKRMCGSCHWKYDHIQRKSIPEKPRRDINEIHKN